MKFHKETDHSYHSVRRNASFLDWRTQPRSTKHYPHFQLRYKLEENELLDDLKLTGTDTYRHNYPEGPYYLRTVPSAGALYPCEVYVQLRAVKGMIDGIYHYEPLKDSLTLLHEIDSDGVEHYFGDARQNRGFTFLISAVYFRSSWKYKDRAIRYILLDSGHQLGSLYAALCVMGLESTIHFEFDKLTLNKAFGFRDDEAFTCALSAAQKGEKEIAKLKQTLPYVSGCDYLETNRFIEESYRESAEYSAEPIEKLPFFEHIPKEQLRQAILMRRSIRAFAGGTIGESAFAHIIRDLFEFAAAHEVSIYYTLHDVEGQSIGLYRYDELLQEGNFRPKSRYLALEQNLGGQSGVTFYFTSAAESTYQKAYILSGFIAQIIYLRCSMENIGCSGIGAYYDTEVQEFLGTEENVLYMLAIGK